jgi:Uma2 family endonuclease
MVRVTSPSTRFTVAEYFKMARGGVFGDRRTELINGRIYRMAPQALPHMTCLSKGAKLLMRLALETDWVFRGGTMRIDKYSAPEPDLLWLPVPIGTPLAQWPSPVLLIEISDTSYKKDSGVKLQKYAEHAIPDYWIVNVNEDSVEVYRDPQSRTNLPQDSFYASRQRFTRGQSIPLLLRPDVSIPVADLLP